MGYFDRPRYHFHRTAYRDGRLVEYWPGDDVYRASLHLNWRWRGQWYWFYLFLPW